MYAVTAVHDYDAFIKLQNVLAYVLQRTYVVLACDAIKFPNTKLYVHETRS
jgi:hypothetical protein